MSEILAQLGINETYYIQLGLVVIVFFFLDRVFFRPFLALIETRHKQTVQDKEAAAKMLMQAEEKLEEYQRRLKEARQTARQEYDSVVSEAKKQETEILSTARQEVKTILQQTAAETTQQKEALMKSIEKEVSTLAKSVSERLLVKD